MKQKLLITIIILVILGISAFIIINNKNKNDINDNQNNNMKTDKDDKNMNNINMKNLVLYFSATGTTKEVAKTIAEVTNADIIEIEPKEKYTSDDLDYNGDCRANKEQNDNSSRPEIKNQINIEGYDMIYIGYPIWWGTNPKIILTLLDSYNFDGKNIVLFCTSGSTGISESLSDIKAYNTKMNVLDGKRLTSSMSKSEIEAWINTLNKLE